MMQTVNQVSAGDAISPRRLQQYATYRRTNRQKDIAIA